MLVVVLVVVDEEEEEDDEDDEGELGVCLYTLEDVNLSLKNCV